MPALGTTSDQLSNNFQLSPNFIFSITTSEIFQYLKSWRFYQTSFYFCSDSNNVGITFWCLCSTSFMRDRRKRRNDLTLQARLRAPYCPTPGRPGGDGRTRHPSELYRWTGAAVQREKERERGCRGERGCPTMP